MIHCFEYMVRLVSENKRIIGHGVNDCQGFQADTHIADGLAAGLEAFFDYDSCAFQGCAGFSDDINETKKSASVCEKIVDQKDMILWSEKFLG